MRRKLLRTVALVCGLMFVMGADTIDWDAGQPVANPGGKASTLEGKGTYSVDPANTGGTVSLWAQQQGGIATPYAATKNNGKWDCTVGTLAAKQYDTWGEIVTWDPAAKKFNYTTTTKVTVTIK